MAQIIDLTDPQKLNLMQEVLVVAEDGTATCYCPPEDTACVLQRIAEITAEESVLEALIERGGV